MKRWNLCIEVEGGSRWKVILVSFLYIYDSWRKLHNDELHSLYSSPNIVRVIKSRRMRWARHVARMGRGEVLTGFWLGGLKARDHWKDQGVDGRITLRWILGRQGSMGRTGFGWLRIGSIGELLWTRWWTFGFRKKAGYFLTSQVTISFSNSILHHGVSELVYLH
jgi:hypothetical protein